jgi:hypothetical protein
MYRESSESVKRPGSGGGAMGTKGGLRTAAAAGGGLARSPRKTNGSPGEPPPAIRQNAYATPRPA